jgi:DNA repair exonuclease SbcCD ATPase subunit
VNIRRPGRDELDRSDTRESEELVVAAGALRAAEARPPEPVKAHGGHVDDRMSVFWRVFGGTILSILALIAVTLYNNLQSTVAELRTEISRSNEARAELVKKEEFNSRSQTLWDRVQALQELKVTVGGLKEQVAACGEKQGDVKAVRDQLAAVDAKLKAAEDDHKALSKAELTITALEQKTAARDAQLKAVEDERKEMAKQMTELRERLAKVEGVTEVKPMPKSSGPAKGQ